MTSIIPIKEAPEDMGLVPATMAEAMQLADMMASARLVPRDLQKSPADCLQVILQATRWRMDPFAVAQECAVIQGKLMYQGKLVAAVINSRGRLIDRLSYDYDGAGDDRTITVSGRLKGEAEPRTVTVQFRDARTANKIWQTQPDQQLMYHGVRVWARRHAPELMLGVQSPEEFDDPAPLAGSAKKPSPPKPNVLLPSPPVTAAADAIPAHDTETGEIAETEPDESPSPTDLDAYLAEAAERGSDVLKTAWDRLLPEHQKLLRTALNRRHKPRAAEVDQKA